MPFHSAPCKAVTAVAVFYLLTAGFAHYRIQWTPQVASSSAPSNRFSEERALEHVHRLSATGRLVSHPDIEIGAQYIFDVLQSIEQMAADNADIKIEVERQQVSGGINMLFLDTMIANAYNNLTNLILAITPRAAKTDKAVLVGAHFDSVIGSLGASDCLSQVAVMLEAARVIAVDPGQFLEAPIVFLFNGGEETFSQAAHGFMQHNRRKLGAFINLESTGPGGPDYLFQHTGGWTAQAYATAAKYPRGASLGQDIFDSGLLPADSDYRMFSYEHYGTLPGLDIAFLLDGGAYHTDRDVVDRIRRGTLQAMGENLLAALPSFAAVLAQPHAQPQAKSVYFDVLGYFMVVYSLGVAKILHNVPTLMVISIPTLTFFSGRPSASYGAVSCAALVSLFSMVSATLCSMSVGAARVLLLGRPMVWYAQHLVGFCIHVPAAAAGALLPYALLSMDLHQALLGAGMWLGLLASLLASFSMGSAFLPGLCGFSCIVAGLSGAKARGLAWVLILSVPPVLLSMPLYFLLTNVLMDKASMMGVLPKPVGPAVPDMIIGAIIGLSTFLVMAAVIPWLGTRLPPKFLKGLIFGLLAAGACTAVGASVMLQPYSIAAPKRVLMQHMVMHDMGGEIAATKLVIAGSDAVHIHDVVHLASHDQYNRSHQDWQTMYPLTDRLAGEAIAARQFQQPVASLPSITLSRAAEQGFGVQQQRMYLELSTGQPCWGVLNMTGRILDWSFSEGLPAANDGQAGHLPQIVRIAGDRGSEVWPFWVDIEAGSILQIELSASFWDRVVPEVREFVSSVLPPWTTLLGGTTCTSIWHFQHERSPDA